MQRSTLRRLTAAATVSYLAVDIRVFSIKGRLGHRNRCGNNGAAGCVPQVPTRASVSFRAEKLRLGRADPCDDIATIKAVRNAIGDDIDLMVDFNQALNLADAVRRCHMIDDHGLVWTEEPVVYDDFDSCRPARRRTAPIQIGENFVGPATFTSRCRRRPVDTRN